MNSYMEFLDANIDELLVLITTHIKLTLTAVMIAIIVGIPLGIIIASRKGLDKPVLGFANIMQAIPSLAALGLLVPFIGIGAPPAILMVVLYSLLPILKNTYTGIKGVNPQTVEAAYGLGMTKLQVLLKVKIPVALPVIMSGVRISSVTAVGLMTIASYIGAGGLGNFVISGIQMNNVYLILSGAVPACVLALTMDFVMNKVEKAVTPISMSMKAGDITPTRIAKHKTRKRITLVIVAILIATLLTSMIAPLLKPQDKNIVVGCKPVTESYILANIMAELIEEKTDLTVERKLGLGMTSVVYEGIKNGDIHMYPEYSGSIYAEIYKGIFVPGTTPEELMDEVQGLAKADGLYYSEPYGLNNRYSLGMLTETAEKYGITTISELAAMDKKFTLACSEIFPRREDGALALQSVYGLEFAEFLQFQGALMYEALDSGEVEIMTPYTTDALLNKYDITILEDDKSAFSNYNMASVVSQEILDSHPELYEVLELMENNISDEEMMEMNYKAVVDGETPLDIAKEFVEQKGWVTY